MWCPKPNEIVSIGDGGSANMGTLPLFDGPPRPSDVAVSRSARFYLEVDYWCLAFARVHFFGGTGTATLYLYVDSRLGRNHDTNIWTVTGCGTTGNDANIRVVPGDFHNWTFRRGDELVFTWTNPDTGNMAWGIECGLADASNA